MDAALMGKLSVSEAVYRDCFIDLLIKRRFCNMQFIACLKCSGNLSIYSCVSEEIFLLTFLRCFEFFINIPLGRRAFKCYWVALQNFFGENFLSVGAQIPYSIAGVIYASWDVLTYFNDS